MDRSPDRQSAKILTFPTRRRAGASELGQQGEIRGGGCVATHNDHCWRKRLGATNPRSRTRPVTASTEFLPRPPLRDQAVLSASMSRAAANMSRLRCARRAIASESWPQCSICQSSST